MLSTGVTLHDNVKHEYLKVYLIALDLRRFLPVDHFFVRVNTGTFIWESRDGNLKFSLKLNFFIYFQ